MELDILDHLKQIEDNQGFIGKTFLFFIAIKIIGWWVSTAIKNDTDDKIIAELKANNYLLQKLLEQQKENKEKDNE